MITKKVGDRVTLQFGLERSFQNSGRSERGEKRKR